MKDDLRKHTFIIIRKNGGVPGRKGVLQQTAAVDDLRT